jgi:hypothetical protein
MMGAGDDGMDGTSCFLRTEALIGQIARVRRPESKNYGCQLEKE